MPSLYLIKEKMCEENRFMKNELLYFQFISVVLKKLYVTLNYYKYNKNKIITHI